MYQQEVMQRVTPVIPAINTYVTIPPPTPGPKTVENIKVDAKDRFSGVICIQKDNDRTLEDYFYEYDYWEPYSESKSYSKRTYQAAYKGIMKEYNNYLCVMQDADETEKYYVVAKRIRSKLETLEPYCTCLTCSSSIFNPLKYIWCAHCTRCIKAGTGFADPQYIEKAESLKKQKEQKVPLSIYRQYINNIKWIKVGEVTLVATAVSIGFVAYLW